MEVQYCDQTGARPPTAAGALAWTDGVPITARLMIAERIRLEFEPGFARYELRGGEAPAPLFAPRIGRAALTEAQAVEKALAAFAANRFFLIVDRRQIVDLDAPFPLTPASSVVFLRLTPLKGG